MISFTDLPDSVVIEILCDWCGVIILAKVDSAFCSNHDNARTWLLNIMYKQYYTVPESVEFTGYFLNWAFVRAINLKDLRLINKLFKFGQLVRFCELNKVEALSFELCVKSRYARYKKEGASRNKNIAFQMLNRLSENLVRKYGGATPPPAVEDNPEGDDFEHNGLVTVINDCPKLRKLCINRFVVFNDSHMSLVSPQILSQLESLTLDHETLDLKETFDVLSARCNHLNTLVLSGEMMCCEGVMKLISSNSQLKSIAVDCPLVSLADLCDSLSSGGCEQITHITVKRFLRNLHNNAGSATRLLEQQKDQSLILLDIEDVILYAVAQDGNSRKHILLRIGGEYIVGDACDVLFGIVPVIDMVCIDLCDDFCVLNPERLLHKVVQYYTHCLTSVVLHDSSFLPSFSSGIVENMLKSCVNVDYLMLHTTNKLGCKRIEKLGELCPHLRHIEFNDLDKITTATVIAMLRSAKSNVTKVTARFCRQVVASEVHEAVVKLNAKKNKTKTVEFEDEACGPRGLLGTKRDCVIM